MSQLLGWRHHQLERQLRVVGAGLLSCQAWAC
jgi:hypothetical protein